MGLVKDELELIEELNLLKRHSMLTKLRQLINAKSYPFSSISRTYLGLAYLKREPCKKTEEYLERAAELLSERQPIEADLEETKKLISNHKEKILFSIINKTKLINLKRRRK